MSVPPLVLKVVVPPTQRAKPDSVDGRAFTVTCLVVKQPVELNVKVMSAVPAAMPDTTPDASTVAIEGLLELHVPPEEVVARVVVAPIQTLATPVIAAGFGLMETVTLPSGPQQPPADCARK